MSNFAAQRSNFDQLEPATDRLRAPSGTPPQLGAEQLASAGAMDHLRAMSLSGPTNLADLSLVRNGIDFGSRMSMAAAESSEPSGLAPEVWRLLASPNELGHGASRAKKNGGDGTI